MAKGQHWQNARFVFEGCDLYVLSLFIFLSIYVQKGMDVSFLMPLESLCLTSRAQALHKTSIGGQICQLSPIYFFLNLTSKSSFKT